MDNEREYEHLKNELKCLEIVQAWWKKGDCFGGFILLLNLLAYIWCVLFDLVKYDGFVLFIFSIFGIAGLGLFVNNSRSK